MIEDYQAAHGQRDQDTGALHRGDRKIAAMHWGGCTIECLLKAMILAQIGNPQQRQWHTSQQPQPHGIERPGHDLQDALRKHQKLADRVNKFPEVRSWLSRVNDPGGHFIHLRYSADEPDSEAYKEWWTAYERLYRWLVKQTTQM
ncbi:hypothetical protein [Prochlorothrix hollandica]|uniref:hypothetical protein n=1 Tax=Prochlorothrix hollandica TaxID=1223 RepID=UPI000346489A|nr:hypothetical protein [Prochlorothrix hollandica]